MQVVYGFIELKTHAKVCLVVRREGGSLRTYVPFRHRQLPSRSPPRSTPTCRFFTADPALGRDAAQLFNYITGYAEPDAAGEARHRAAQPARDG